MRTATAVRDAAGEARSAWSGVAWLGAAALAVGVALPLLVSDPLRLVDLTGWLAFALAALGLGLVVGIGGMPSLGQGAFMGIGAFAAALLQTRAGWPVAASVPAAALAGAAAGLVTGAGVVRLRPVFVAVATWILAWLVAVGLAAFPGLSGGAAGIVLPPSAVEPWLWYEIVLLIVGLAAGGFALLARGLPGLALAAAHQHPPAAAALGLPSARLRLVAFALAAGIGALAGALDVQAAGVADPASYGPLLSFELLAAVVLGGAARALGPLAGTAAVALAGVAVGALSIVGTLRTDRFAPMLTAILVFAALSLGGTGIVPQVVRRGRAAPAPARVEPPPAAQDPAVPTLRATGLARRFGELVALEDFAVELAPGRICALIGPNGSGKTTALRLLAGAVRADAGRVELGGTDVTGAPVAERARAGIVRTIQATAVFPELTALEHVVVGAFLRRRYAGFARTLLATPRARLEAAAAREDAERTLAAFGLAARSETRAGDLNAVEQRLLMLATAAAPRPHVMLLDEPAAGAARDELQLIAVGIGRLRADGVALLLVEHDFSFVRSLADHVVVLDAGLVIASGPPGVVAADPAVRAAYLGGRG
jgi:branched-chain amino acid transport system permease protein